MHPNRAGLEGEGSATRPGQIVEFGNTNDPVITENSPCLQAADTAVRRVAPPIAPSKAASPKDTPSALAAPEAFYGKGAPDVR
jgi:hypothetical protein